MPLEVLWALSLAAFVTASWFLNLVNFPGNWFIVAGTVVYSVTMPDVGRIAIGWQITLAVIVLALAGEIVEFAAGAVGAGRAGGSRTSAVFALLGAIAGGLLGMFVGLPIPVVGPLFGAMLFAACGAFLGAVYGETRIGRPWEHSLRVGKAAFLGRLLGTFGKAAVGAVMVAVILAALVF